MTDEDKALVHDLRYRGSLDRLLGGTMHEAADRIEALIAENELLKREKACVDDALEQQSDLALEYLNDCNEAVAYIETLTNCNSVDGLKEMHFDEFAALPKGLVGKPVLYAVWPSPMNGDEQ